MKFLTLSHVLRELINSMCSAASSIVAKKPADQSWMLSKSNPLSCTENSLLLLLPSEMLPGVSCANPGVPSGEGGESCDRKE